VEEKEALRGQRGLLADAATAQAKTRDTLQWLVDAEVKAIAAGERVSPLPADVLDAPPMTRAEAAALGSDMRAWTLRCGQDGGLERADVDDAVFGWRTRCLAVSDGSHRVWTSSKRVETTDTPLELCRRSLEVLTSHRDTRHGVKAEGVALLAPWTGAEVATVQTIDADHVLLHVNRSGLFLCACEPFATDGEGCMLSIQPVECATADDNRTRMSMGEFRSAAANAAMCWYGMNSWLLSSAGRSVDASRCLHVAGSRWTNSGTSVGEATAGRRGLRATWPSTTRSQRSTRRAAARSHSRRRARAASGRRRSSAASWTSARALRRPPARLPRRHRRRE
jgi:hypothetical protein